MSGDSALITATRKFTTWSSTPTLLPKSDAKGVQGLSSYYAWVCNLVKSAHKFQAFCIEGLRLARTCSGTINRICGDHSVASVSLPPMSAMHQRESPTMSQTRLNALHSKAAGPFSCTWLQADSLRERTQPFHPRSPCAAFTRTTNRDRWNLWTDFLDHEMDLSINPEPQTTKSVALWDWYPTEPGQRSLEYPFSLRARVNCIIPPLLLGG